MSFKLFVILGLTLFTYTLTAQSHAIVEEHEDHNNEIGVANSAVYFVKEKIFAYGLHLHYVRNIPKSKFGAGLGYERIFDEHKHTTVGIPFIYNPVGGLNFNVSPGLLFEEGIQGVSPALHLETSYEFEVKNFHIGPSLEFAFDPEDIHISLGLHLGYGF